jgi:hypothetical protein
MAEKATILGGQCRIQVDSTSQISLQRYNGVHVPVKVGSAWEAKIIPSGGTALANTGLTAATLYYIYAFDSGGTLTLEASTTAHAVDTDTGIRIKSGDATRTLVGMVFMDSGTPGTFVDSVTKRWCANWFNRRRRHLVNHFTANRTYNTTIGEVNSEIRVQFLTWDDELVEGHANGSMTHSVTTGLIGTFIGLDGASTLLCSHSIFPLANNGSMVLALIGEVTTTEGNHFLTIVARVSSGTSTYYGSANFPETTTNFERVMLRGAVMI